jgi:hypothetical protein
VKLIGGMDYNYAVKGDGQLITKSLSNLEQITALNAVKKTLQAKYLVIPEKVLALFPPRAYGYARSRESFQSLNVGFDAIGAAATASQMTLNLVLNPQRANRLVQQNAMDTELLSLNSVLEELIDVLFISAEVNDTYKVAVNKSVQFQLVQQLFNLAVSSQSIPQTRSLAFESLEQISCFLKRDKDAFSKYIKQEIIAFKKDPSTFKKLKTPKIPDGSPIGSFQCQIFTTKK